MGPIERLKLSHMILKQQLIYKNIKFDLMSLNRLQGLFSIHNTIDGRSHFSKTFYLQLRASIGRLQQTLSDCKKFQSNMNVTSKNRCYLSKSRTIERSADLQMFFSYFRVQMLEINFSLPLNICF